MRRIKKDLNDIPGSLRVDSESIHHNPAKTTYERRQEIISYRNYPESSKSSKYDSRYKMVDIKDQLEKIYLRKCAYCETFVEQMVVEHYRPKRGGYYWLAYSWDNLLLACPTCNGFKGDAFPVSKDRVVYEPGRDKIERIHQLGSQYDKLECPLMVNPEKASPSEISSLQFEQDGRISSDHVRMNQTIETCKLYRKSLCERRQKIWDDLGKEIRAAAHLAGDDKAALRIRLSQVIESFSIKSNDPTQEYTALRQFILNKSTWIADFVKDLLGE